MVSRVVPGISETMARSSFRMALSKVDLPTFGSPMMATGMPLFSTFPMEKLLTSSPISLFISSRRFTSCSLLANSTSSSLKSSSSSISDAKSTSFFRRSLIFSENPPRIWSMARSCERFEDEAIRSATASACDKSNFPFIKALRVNSPGSA